MTNELTVSVIIPTFNRQESVLRALSSMDGQTMSPDRFEVIVVDDGSSYELEVIQGMTFPFGFQFIRKQNEGATVARNFGVKRSRGDVLVLMDDDVTISSSALEGLAAACMREEKVLAMGHLIDRNEEKTTVFTQDALDINNGPLNGNGRSPDDQFIHFTRCNTQLLAIKRDDFYALGMLQDPTGGWPNWDDVDFGYRAHLAGYRLLQVGQVVGEHWDYSLANLETACRRWRRAGKSAVRLFHVHPGLAPHIPMFHDKTPINWQHDPLRLIARKIARQLSATSFILKTMEKATTFVEKVYPTKKVIRPLYRWIQGSYMFLGYREGIKEYA